MTREQRPQVKSRKYIGIALLVCSVISYPLLHYYFRNFYFGSCKEYKYWYPHLYFIIYPAVKVFPLVVLGLLFVLLRETILNILLQIKRLPALLFNTRDVLKKIALKYLPGIFILTITLSIILPLAEYALLKNGFKPGYRLYSIYFNPVDSLYSINGFYADSNGIFCISQQARESIRNEMATKNFAYELTPYSKNESPEVYGLSEDFLKFRDSSYHSEFKSFIEKVNSPPDTTERDFFDAVKAYVKCPINSNGFKSIEFKKYNSTRKTILLLGDSFAWGHSTSNKTNSFADLLLAKGYIVFNTGISGTDPGQYLQVAKVLIPQLNPDFVIVNFYMGNDIQYFNREPKPFMPVLYCTNAGNLVSCPEGVYLNNVEEAYDYTLSVFTIPTKNNYFNKLCSKTAFGTLLWRVLAKFGLADVRIPGFKEYTEKVRQSTTKKPYSDEKLRQIREITHQYNGKFLLIAIPLLDGNKFIFPKDHEGLFERLEYSVPTVRTEYFNSFDGHFNDAGSSKYALFIDSLVRANQ